MSAIALVGSGKIGEMIAEILISSGDYRVTLIDVSHTQLARIPDREGLRKVALDVTNEDALADLLGQHYAVISAAPYFLTVAIARAAKRARIHYLDLTEDVASTRQVQELAQDAETTFIPQCGLAPGFISIVSNDIASRFDSLDSVRMRVGALPQFPSNSLNYNLTWSTEGVINEYCEPCLAIIDGELATIPPLEHLEHFSLEGIRYESFNTSGGLGTLGDTFAGKVNHISYQTIRYPGHRDIMKTLLQDLRLRERRDLLKDVLEHAVPSTLQDVVLIFVSVTGTKNGRLVQETYANKVYSEEVNGTVHSAIQITTSNSVCAVLDMLSDGTLPQRGFVKQEQIGLEAFLANRFGRAFRQLKSLEAAA
jgi:saccharopine dehydrogenase-like NADP-dependent oxidoreductase